MLSPDLWRSQLDRQLADKGEDIILRRKSGTGSNILTVDVICRAKVSALSLQEIAAGINQTDQNVVISTTQIDAAQWPGGTAQPAAALFDVDPRIPRIGQDNVIVQKRLRTVAFVAPKYIDGVLVRVDIRVTG